MPQLATVITQPLVLAASIVQVLPRLSVTPETLKFVLQIERIRRCPAAGAFVTVMATVAAFG
jgi:hypothetical protein